MRLRSCLIRSLCVALAIIIMIPALVLAEGEYETTGVGGFVSRMYTVVLDRNPDPIGYADWVTRLTTGSNTGADVARGFLYSDEFINRGLSHEEYVTVLYNLFFDRAPDAVGLADWVGRLDSGASSEDILNGFINSVEWANTCVSFGIQSGGNGVATVSPTVTDGMVRFVTSLYSECLGRTPGQAEVDSWTNLLADGSRTGKEVAYGFFFSEEFRNRCASMTNDQLIGIYYTVFLNRGPDANGLQTWRDTLAAGGGIAQLFNGFADSTEFAQKCAACGVTCGPHLDVPDVATITLDSAVMQYFNYAYDIQRGIQRIDAVTPGESHRNYVVHEIRSSTPTDSERTISDGDLASIERFAAENFIPGWTNGQKLAYTCWWINRNVTYASNSGLWAQINNCGYAQAIFDKKIGQCAQYNGALVEMACWLGYDASMVSGYRTRANGSTFNHYWGEITLDGVTYVLEAGNYGDSGDWHFFVCQYSETSKFIR